METIMDVLEFAKTHLTLPYFVRENDLRNRPSGIP